MLLQPHVNRNLVRTGQLAIRYNSQKLFKKYELGYWEIFQDVALNQEIINGPYQVFRPIYSSSKLDKVTRKYDKRKDA